MLHNVRLTYCFVKVHQVELFGFWEEFSFMHETDVENDVGSFCDFSAFDDVVFQSFSHREINHRMKPQRLVDETLHHFQALIINVFIFITWKLKGSIHGLLEQFCFKMS